MEEHPQDSPIPEPRRKFTGRLALVSMVVGLLGGYGAFLWNAFRFLFPPRTGERIQHFVCRLDQLQVGESLEFTTPAGALIVVARQDAGDKSSSFIALSSVCPHLGCKVHWEAARNRFFCPCHNGAFNAQGEPTAGPPAKANQPLTRFPLAVHDNLLMIELPTESLEVGQDKKLA